MADQDWQEVTFQKNAKQKSVGLSSARAISNAKAGGMVSTEKKLDIVHGGLNQSAHQGAGAGARKLEESTEDFKHATVNKDLSKAIQTARLAKKLTQAQLATQINERQQIIQQYESGQAIPNPQILVKLDKALGIHLPRSAKKKK